MPSFNHTLEAIGVYYNGVNASSQGCEVYATSTKLLIKITDTPESLTWDFSDIKILEKPEADRPLYIHNKKYPDAALVLENNGLYRDLVKVIPGTHAPLVSLSASWKGVMFWIIPAVLIIAFSYWSLPMLSYPIAKRFPPEWEKSIGDYAIKSLTEGKRRCSNPGGVAALNKLSHALAVAGNVNNISVMVVADKNINAFAAPGGKVVVFSKLIETSQQQEELAGVLAHEMAHGIKLHPTQSLVRSLGLQLMATLLFGGGDFASVASAAGELYYLRHSRQFESEADAIAADILYKTGLSNEGFIQFFQRMQATPEEKIMNKLSYLSSHPPTGKRIKALRKFKSPPETRPILSTEEWQALKKICD